MALIASFGPSRGARAIAAVVAVVALVSVARLGIVSRDAVL